MQSLVERYRTLERRFGATNRSTARPRREIPPDQRRQALARIVAAAVQRTPAVEAFRDEVLGGMLLEPGAVPLWIKEQAASQGYPTLWLSDVPLPPNAARRLESRDWRNVLPDLAGKVKWDDLAESLPPRVEQLWYYDSSDERLAPKRVAIARGSALDALRRVVDVIAAAYPAIPNEPDIVDLVLTGRPPPLPLGVLLTENPEGEFVAAADHPSVPHRGQIAGTEPQSAFPALETITLKLSPRVSPREVAKGYAQLRASIVGPSHRDRPISPKRIELAVFAAVHNDGRAWRELMSSWNSEHREARYTDVRRFIRDCRLGYQQVTGAKLDWIGVRGRRRLQ